MYFMKNLVIFKVAFQSNLSTNRNLEQIIETECAKKWYIPASMAPGHLKIGTERESSYNNLS